MKKIILFIGIVGLFIGCGVRDMKDTPHSVIDMMGGNMKIAGWKEFKYPESNKTVIVGKITKKLKSK